MLFDTPHNSVDEQIDCNPIKMEMKLWAVLGKKLSPRARKEIVQTLVTLLITKVGSNPTRAQCESIGRRLILKYPLMRDDIGTGYVSYTFHNAMSQCMEGSPLPYVQDPPYWVEKVT